MNRLVSASLRTVPLLYPLLWALIFSLVSPRRASGEPTQAATQAFDAYVAVVEARLSREHKSTNDFLGSTFSNPQDQVRLRGGETIVDRLTPTTGAILPGALLHHWRGTAFAPGATATDFERLLRNFDAYPQRFSPQVLRAKVVGEHDGHLEAWMRVRQKHVLTVVMDSTYDVAFGRVDAQHGYSVSRSTRIYEIDGAGTANERALNATEEHGFLWRLNT